MWSKLEKKLRKHNSLHHKLLHRCIFPFSFCLASFLGVKIASFTHPHPLSLHLSFMIGNYLSVQFLFWFNSICAESIFFSIPFLKISTPSNFLSRRKTVWVLRHGWYDAFNQFILPTLIPIQLNQFILLTLIPIQGNVLPLF